MNDQQPGPCDYQLAAALIAHRADASVEGMATVVHTATEANRTTALLIAAIRAYWHILDELRTEQARAAINEYIAICSSQTVNPDARRAAAAALAVRDGDTEGFNQVTAAANAAGRAAQLLGAVLDCFHGLLPELATPSAKTALATWCARWAATTLNDDHP